MMADDPCVGIGRLENGEEARRGREKRTPGAQEGTCVGLRDAKVTALSGEPFCADISGVLLELWTGPDPTCYCAP